MNPRPCGVVTVVSSTQPLELSRNATRLPANIVHVNAVLAVSKIRVNTRPPTCTYVSAIIQFLVLMLLLLLLSESLR